MEFIDPHPPCGSEVYGDAEVVCGIRVYSFSGKVEEGVLPEYKTNDSAWSGEGIEYKRISDNEVKFKAAVDSFEVGENSKKWRIKGNELVSERFYIDIPPNFTPEIDVIQPEERSGLKPVVEARAVNYAKALDEESIAIRIYDRGGDAVLVAESSDTPGIFDSSRDLIRYSSGYKVLEAGEEYELQIHVSDSGYKEKKTSVEKRNFTAKGEFISDFTSFPNPFDNRASDAALRYVIEDEADVTVNVYDSSGSLVKTIVKAESRKAGENKESWDGRDFTGAYVANGVYFCEVVAEGENTYKSYTAAVVYAE